MKMKYIMIIVTALIVTITNVYAAGDLAKQAPITVDLSMSDYKF
jgi:hypothetical protein